MLQFVFHFEHSVCLRKQAQCAVEGTARRFSWLITVLTVCKVAGSGDGENCCQRCI